MSVEWILRLCALCFALSTGLESAPAAVSAASSSSRCPNEYTWNSGRYGYELLKPKDEMCGSSTLCMSPYPRPASSDEYPPPVPTDSVQLEFIGEPANNSTCLKITYHLDQYGAVNILGMQFLLHGLGYNSHNTHCCQILNYTVPLGYDAAFRNGQNYDFIFDCFCDLWPQEEYRLTIRSLPVDFENQSLIDDSSYVEDFVVPACTPARSWDQYCQQSKEEQWRPQHIVLQQIFPNYTRMTVTFNIAPFSFRFTYYVVSLYENGGSLRPISTKSATVGEPEFIVFEINMDGLQMNATNVTFELAKEHLGKEVFAEILPRCESNLDCNTVAVASDNIVILENPCDSTPCGNNGSCTPMEAIYSCECDPTFIFDGSTCIDHPCKSNPCTDLGVCSLDGLEYVCDCNNSAINTGKTCIPNPCQSNPCDPYSTCEIDEDTFKHNCGCPNGVTCIIDKCKTREYPDSPCLTMAECRTDMKESTTHYICDCPEQFSHANISDICADDTCNSDECNDHGSCAFRRTTEGAEYNCSCNSGFVREPADGLCKKDTPQEMYLLIACALIVLAIIVAFSYAIKRMRSKRSNHPPYINQDPEPSYQPVHPDEKRVLIISTEESEEHKDVVQKFAAFIREHVGVVPILPSQHKMEIQKSDLETWLSSQNQHAFKVVFICSRGTREWWNAAKSGCNSLVGASIFGDPFQKMVTITKKERETIGVKGKFLTAYFEDYATWEDIPEFLNDRPCYNLMRDLGELSFALLNTEKDTPTSKRRMPEVDNYDLQPEGKALVQAIAKVASLNRRTFQPTHPPRDMPVTSRQPMMELFDHQIPLDPHEVVPLDLMEIPCHDPGMESIRGIFSSTVAEVGDKHNAGASDQNMDSGFETLPSPSQNGSASIV